MGWEAGEKFKREGTYIHLWLTHVVVWKKRKKVLVIQSCPTCCHPMDCSLPRSCVHRTLQARILEWVAIPFSRGSSWPRDRTQVSCIASRFFAISATREAPILHKCSLKASFCCNYYYYCCMFYFGHHLSVILFQFPFGEWPLLFGQSCWDYNWRRFDLP